jgi:hypothetical protein
MSMIEIPSSRQDKFGFYQVGEFRTYSKFEATEQHTKTNQPITWNFNQEVYSAHDWTQEPTETLSELYRQRAQELRDQYDYLVLWYSGGADSANILETFLHHNIKLDEVASYINHDATGSKTDFLNGEIFHVAAPTVERAKQQQPWLQHTVLDLSQLTMDFFLEESTKFDWIYQVNGYVNPNTAARRDIKLKVPHWVKMFDSGKRVGFIYGTDKPRVAGINGKYYFKFVDMVDNTVNVNSQTENRPWEFNELFYWAPDHPNIVIKQGHVVKNYFKSAKPNTEFIVGDPHMAGTSYATINKKIHWLTPSGMHTLIYPWWYPVPYQVKPPSVMFSPRDHWFFNLSDSDPAKTAWRIGLEHCWKITPDALKKEVNNITKGFKNISSVPYYLGT